MATNLQYTNTISDLVNSVKPKTDLVVEVLARDQLASGGGGLFRWVDGSSLPTDGGTVFNSNYNNPQGQWLRLFEGEINVRWFGALGNGSDDTAGIQDALAFMKDNGGTLFFPEGQYLVTSPLYLTGDVNVKGEGIQSELVLRMTNQEVYSIVVGAASPTDTTPWRGTFEKLRIDCGNHVENATIINLFRAEDYVFRDLLFHHPFAISIKANINSNFATGFIRRRNGKYLNINIVIDPTIDKEGRGGISVTAGSSDSESDYDENNHFWVENCRMTGTSDDPIAFHGNCKNIFIRNNYLEGKDGRILISHGRDVIIDSNEMRHTTTQGWFISAFHENDKAGQPKNFIVTNNICHTVNGEGDGPRQILRFNGVDGLTISNNQLINNYTSDHVTRSIEVKDDEANPSKIFRAKNTVITDNFLQKGFMDISGTENDGIVITGNQINQGYIEIQNSGVITNNAISVVPFHGNQRIYKINTFKVTADEVITFTGTLIDATTVVFLETNEIPTFIYAANAQILKFEARLESAIEDGSDLHFQVGLMVGQNLTTFDLILPSGSADPLKKTFAVAEANQLVSPAGSTLQARVIPQNVNTQNPAGLKVVLKVYLGREAPM